MGFVIPQPVKNYVAGNPLPVYSSKAYREPKEGKCFIPIAIAWDGAAGGTTTQHVNISGTSAQAFTQIVMLDVDNTESSADVTFYFPDTTDTLVVPAYSAGLFPVFTEAVAFYAAAPAALATDQTFLRVLNYRQEPIANPAPQFHNVINSAPIAFSNADVTQALIPATQSGTLVGYTLSLGGITGAADGTAFVQLIDHTTNAVIDGFFVEQLNALSVNESLVVNGTAYRFKGGVDVKISLNGSVWNGGFVTATARYRSP